MELIIDFGIQYCFVTENMECFDFYLRTFCLYIELLKRWNFTFQNRFLSTTESIKNKETQSIAHDC